MMRVILSGALACLVLGSGADGSSQDAKQEYDLTWKVPHSHAAFYDLHDVQKGTSLGEFCLLGCELESTVGANEPLDLAYRYLFRRIEGRCKPGDRRQVDEDVFHRSFARSAAPMKVRGAYHIQPVRMAKLGDLFKALRSSKDLPSDPVEVLLVEGRFELTSYRFQGDGKSALEKKPTATLVTVAAVRVSDGAVVAGRYSWQGTLTRFLSFDTRPVRVADAVELILKSPPSEISLDGLRERIERAVARGATWLKSKQEGSGRFADMQSYWGLARTDTGATALAALALLHSGTGAADPIIRKGTAYSTQFKFGQAYSVAALLMAVEAKYLPLGSYQELKSYDEKKVRERLQKEVSKEDRALVQGAARWLIDSQLTSGSWGYDSGATLPNVSVVQYALLGLKSASRMGVEVPAQVWTKALDYLLSGMQVGSQETAIKITRLDGSVQEAKGALCSWGYYAGKEWQTWPEVTGSLTLAALASLAICDSELERTNGLDQGLRRRLDAAQTGGLAWLSKNYAPRTSLPEGAWLGNAMVYYYLYSLERAGVFMNVKCFGEHDWYLEGAAILISEQEADGRWESSFGIPVVDTSFALLFLKRASVPVKTPAPVASEDVRRDQPRDPKDR